MGPWLRRFITRDDGVATVDWVVLTSVMVALCIAVFSTLGTPTRDTITEMNNDIATFRESN